MPPRDELAREGAGGPRATLALGAAAIAAFALATGALIWAGGGTWDAPAPADPPRAPAVAAPAPLPSPAPPRAASAATPVALAAPATAARLEELDPAWRESPRATRLRGLAGLGPYVFAGLRDARAEMAGCGAAGGAGAGWSPGATVSPALLLLYLETGAGTITVVDVVVEELGGASADEVECCRQVLRGWQMRAPGVAAGRRYRLVHALE